MSGHEVTAEREYPRLDLFLTEEYPQLTRSRIKQLISGGCVLVNGKPAKAGSKVRAGDNIALAIPKQQEIALRPQDIPIDIVYQDEDIAVINKPQGMVTHPAVGNYDGTLVNAILFHIKDLSGINGELRPGIVHRLDKDTSGLLVIAKNDAAHQSLSAQIAEKSAGRIYLALVYGNIREEEGDVRTRIGRDSRDRKKMAVTKAGREAETHYRVLRRYRDYTLVECALRTGRTHQIRVHMKHLGHPVVGDPVYTRRKDKFGLQGQLLHAARLTLRHPRTGEQMEFSAPLPEHFQRVLDILEKSENMD